MMQENIPELSRAEDFLASSISLSLLVAMAASSVFLCKTFERKRGHKLLEDK
jgi:hypothetical protein